MRKLDVAGWLGLAVGFGALFVAVFALRRALQVGPDAHAAALEAASEQADSDRLALKNLRDQVDGLLDRTHRERSRIDGEKGGRPRAGPNGPDPPVMTQAQYKVHLEKTGQRLVDVERALGLA